MLSMKTWNCIVVIALVAVTVTAVPTKRRVAPHKKSGELCYKFNYGDNLQFSRQINPVTAYPEGHAKVEFGVCGGADPGDLIPVGTNTCDNCKWALNGETNFNKCSNSEVCITPPFENCEGNGFVNAGSNFYAYDYPFAFSSNVGFEKSGFLTMYFVNDEGGDTWFVFNLDKPDNSGGTFTISIEGTNIDTAFVAQMDDPRTLQFGADDCAGETRDCYAWDTVSQRGTFSWTWQACCTDGMVFGPLPDQDFTVTINPGVVSGVGAMQVGSFDFVNNVMEFETFGQQDMLNGFMIEGFTCNDFCESLTNCGTCSAAPACGWCDDGNGGGTCLLATDPAQSQCTDFLDDECCPECEQFTSCETCADHVDDIGCGWCETTQKCISGSQDVPCEDCDDFLFGICVLFCGNNVIDTSIGETCDDGNLIPGDGCSGLCQVEVCGNNIVEAQESCDGATPGITNCRIDCTRCGDNVFQPELGEECDDGNDDNDDTCTNDCKSNVQDEDDNAVDLLIVLPAALGALVVIVAAVTFNAAHRRKNKPEKKPVKPYPAEPRDSLHLHVNPMCRVDNLKMQVKLGAVEEKALELDTYEASAALNEAAAIEEAKQGDGDATMASAPSLQPSSSRDRLTDTTGFANQRRASVNRKKEAIDKLRSLGGKKPPPLPTAPVPSKARATVQAIKEDE